jgi:uroporphyrinogen-III synthase
MITGALVLRPEPGASATRDRLAAIGVDALVQPLFRVVPVAWHPPDPDRFDTLLLTSANAVRHAGPGLAALRHLPVLAVGEATAAAARAAGLSVALTGERDAAALLAAAAQAGFARPLHLAGRDRAGAAVEAITVYASEETPIAAGMAREWAGRVALLHSARAARRFALLVDRDTAARTRIAVAALSPAVAETAGERWTALAVSDRPTDAALVACAATLIDPSGGGVDKRRR